MIRTRCILFVLALALAGIVQAESIPVTQGEIDNLGIRFETPSPATEVAAAEVTARVMVPPAGEAVIAAPLPGLLTTLSVEVGDSVDEGQALAEMMSPDFLELQREFLDALNTYRLAETEIERDRQLHDEGIISVRRLQETTTRSMIASTGLNEHRQLLRIAGLTAAEIHSLQTSQALLDSLEIRAPISGVVVERMATTGQRIDAMAPVYRVADLSELWLQLNVPQEQVSNVVPGMTVSGAGFSAEVTDDRPQHRPGDAVDHRSCPGYVRRRCAAARPVSRGADHGRQRRRCRCRLVGAGHGGDAQPGRSLRLRPERGRYRGAARRGRCLQRRAGHRSQRPEWQ